jgi:hypothetical protein
MTMGRDRRVRGGGVGEYKGECLLDNDRYDNKYNNDDKTMMQRMGRGCVGEWISGGIQLQLL